LQTSDTNERSQIIHGTKQVKLQNNNMEAKITAVIPVRAGSTRVKNKNIRPFADSSLLEIKIEQLKNVPEIDQIIVSSDSDEMLNVAASLGSIPKKRPTEYCDEISKTFNDVVRYIAQEEVDTDIMMWVPCVCPMVSSEKIREGIELYKKQQAGQLPGNGVCTARLIKEYLYGENGPVNFSIEHHVKSQNLPNWHYITNGFFIARRTEMIEWGFVYGPQPLFCEVNQFECVDIDDQADFVLAEMIYRIFNKK